MKLSLVIKRFVDVIISFLILCFLSPFLLFVSLIIRLDSEGAIIFKQQRVGENGEKFYIYKFRSMYVSKNEEEPSPSNDNDPRVTRVGRVLRKLSIDELPQLVNVLKGDMSLIGPRAITSGEITKRINLYSEKTDKNLEEVKKMYRVRQMVKPGMTGLTQINGRSSAGVVNATELDYEYAKKFSLILDFKIIVGTIKILITRRGTN
ncbi:sugar transferase [Peribacillus asahii]|uniref:sugar transferase n=1 Tax=Peribacillus asahii TaxID=228899 RepID=UPI0037FEE455